MNDLKRSCVYIRARSHDSSKPSEGTGFVIRLRSKLERDSRLYVLTAAHVVRRRTGAGPDDWNGEVHDSIHFWVAGDSTAAKPLEATLVPREGTGRSRQAYDDWELLELPTALPAAPLDPQPLDWPMKPAKAAPHAWTNVVCLGYPNGEAEFHGGIVEPTAKENLSLKRDRKTRLGLLDVSGGDLPLGGMSGAAYTTADAQVLAMHRQNRGGTGEKVAIDSRVIRDTLKQHGYVPMSRSLRGDRRNWILGATALVLLVGWLLWPEPPPPPLEILRIELDPPWADQEKILLRPNQSLTGRIDAPGGSVSALRGAESVDADLTREGDAATFVLAVPKWADGPHQILLTASAPNRAQAERALTVVIDGTPPTIAATAGGWLPGEISSFRFTAAGATQVKGAFGDEALRELQGEDGAYTLPVAPWPAAEKRAEVPRPSPRTWENVAQFWTFNKTQFDLIESWIDAGCPRTAGRQTTLLSLNGDWAGDGQISTAGWPEVLEILETMDWSKSPIIFPQDLTYEAFLFEPVQTRSGQTRADMEGIST